jgi:DNA replicative helicase MCM subunit Mcm2 (Cdc46/Mcm family)
MLENSLRFKLGQDMFTTMHHNKTVTLEGIIKQAKPVTPELITATFECETCGKKIKVEQGGGKCKLLPPEECNNKSCQNENQKFKFIQKTSTFTDYQEIWLKPIEPPKIKLGRGQKVILKKKLVGGKEGENIRITGTLGFELKGRTNFAEPVVIASQIKRLD